VKPDDRQMVWLWSADGKAMSEQSDPGVSSQRRTEVFVMGMLPIEGLL